MLEFSPSTIAAGTYCSLEKDYVTIGMCNFTVGRADLPDDLVYQLVKAVFENQPRLVKASSTARDTIPQNVARNAFPAVPSRRGPLLSRDQDQHSGIARSYKMMPCVPPGVVRYYRENSVRISQTQDFTN